MVRVVAERLLKHGAERLLKHYVSSDVLIGSL
jgi:hypothetical protein